MRTRSIRFALALALIVVLSALLVLTACATPSTQAPTGTSTGNVKPSEESTEKDSFETTAEEGVEGQTTTSAPTTP